MTFSEHILELLDLIPGEEGDIRFFRSPQNEVVVRASCRPKEKESRFNWNCAVTQREIETARNDAIIHAARYAVANLRAAINRGAETS